LKKTKLDIPAEKAVLKAAIILMMVASDKKDTHLPVEFKDLCEKFRMATNPFERLDLLEQIKQFEG
jgi:hypothetical protein